VAKKNLINKNVLIISYVFPPVAGIGGRRWAKFAKYLNKKGVNVSVISFTSDNTEISTWAKDVSGINVTWLKPAYPKILNKQPKSIIQKLLYRWQLLRVKILTRGNYYDKAAFSEKLIKQTVLAKIKEKKIDTIIVSGFPFNLTYFISKLQSYIKTKIIVDFRDPWAWKESYSLNVMSSNRKAEEQRKEKYVVQHSDVITVPDQKMMDELCNLYPSQKEKIVHLPHGYDIEPTILSKEAKNQSPKIIYFGTLYANIKNEITDIAKVFEEDKLGCKLDFFCHVKKYMDVFDKRQLIGRKIFYHDALAENELYQKLMSYDYYLLICPDYAKDYIITKIYEIIFHRIPIIFVGKKGRLSQFIEENKLGFFVAKNEIVTKMPLIFNSKLSLNYNYNFPIENYSVDIITNKLIELL